MNPIIRWPLKDNPSLMGDLLEERASGRSRAWYYRQVAIAIPRSLWSGARHHPVLLVRAMAMAAFSYLLLAILTAIGIGYTYGFLWTPADLAKVNPASAWMIVPMILVPTVPTGWLIVRTHRTCAPVAILAIILMWTAAATPWADWIAAGSLMGFLTGAWIANRRAIV